MVQITKKPQSKVTENLKFKIPLAIETPDAGETITYKLIFILFRQTV